MEGRFVAKKAMGHMFSPTNRLRVYERMGVTVSEILLVVAVIVGITFMAGLASVWWERRR